MKKITKLSSVKVLLIATFCLISINSTSAADDVRDCLPITAVKGTNGRVVTGLVYTLKSMAHDGFLDANIKGQGSYCSKAPNSSNAYQMWSISHGSIYSVKFDHYSLRNIAHGGWLDANIKGKNVYCLTPDASNHYQQWDFLTGKYFEDGYVLRSVEHGCHLDANIKGGADIKDAKAYSSTNSVFNNGYQIWKFIPTQYKLTAVIKDFQYHPMVENLNSLAKSSPSSVFFTAENKSYDTPLTIRPNMRESKQNENYWSFTESHERSFFNKLDVDVSASWFGISGNVHNTSEWNTKDTSLEKTRRVNINSTEVSMTSNIVIAPRTKVSYQLNWREVNADIPFTATVKVHGFADLQRKSGPVAHMAKVNSSDGILALLKYAGYSGEFTKDGESILARIRGIVKVKGAIRGDLTMDTTKF